jgi:hypothetical protein
VYIRTRESSFHVKGTEHVSILLASDCNVSVHCNKSLQTTFQSVNLMLYFTDMVIFRFFFKLGYPLLSMSLGLIGQTISYIFQLPDYFVLNLGSC